MDSTREQQQKATIPSSSLAATDTTTMTTMTTMTTTTPPPTPTDDESITTSSASDAFDTWTLVTDKKRLTDIATHSSSSGSGVEQLNKSDDDVNNDNDDDAEHNAAETAREACEREANAADSSIDELSDGISIISESDSGRISPLPLLREHLTNLSFKFSTGVGLDALPHFATTKPEEDECAPLLTPPPAVIEPEQQLRQRRQRRSTSRNAERLVALRPPASEALTERTVVPPFVRRSLTGMFYVIVTLGVLAMLGRLRYPEWSERIIGGGGGAPAAAIEQLQLKLNDMELQNNLMRAEIDLLTKQVSHLNAIKMEASWQKGGAAKCHKCAAPAVAEQQQQHHQQQGDTERKGKMFKAWLGNGKSMEPVQISKEDLRRPYKCGNGKFVEVAGMCVEDGVPSVEPLLDEFGAAFNDVLLQQANLNAFAAENPYGAGHGGATPAQAPAASPKLEQRPKTETPPTGAQYEQQPSNDDLKEQRPERNGHHHGGKRQQHYNNGREQQQPHYKQRERRRHEAADYNDKDKGKCRPKERGSGNGPRERGSGNGPRERGSGNGFRERGSGNGPRERGSGNGPKERPYNNNNKYEQRRRDLDDGRWHERRMQYREQARHNNDRHQQQQRNNKNWYIKRGDSRERQRSIGEEGSGSGEARNR